MKDIQNNKPLKIVQYGGGLGNQMFQYALGVALGDVLWDKNIFEVNHYRSFDLGLYHIDKNFASKQQVKQCLDEVRFKNIIPRFIRKKFNLPKYIYLKTHRVEEKQINKFQPEILNIEGDAYYSGVFQTEKYFKGCREKLLRDLTLDVPLDEANLSLLNKIKKDMSVAVHIRRGDYLDTTGPFTYLDIDYYQAGMNYIAERVENPHFFIFSNDFDWVRKNIKSKFPLTIVDINDEKHGYFDLELMRHCKHNVIANSTFSWWGAWLNENPDKIVIAPKQWFKPTAKEYSGDIVPDEWIKM